MMMNHHHHPSSSSYRGGSTTAGTTTAHHHASTAPPPTRRASPRRAGAASRWCAIGLLIIFTLTTLIDDVLVPRARKHWDARPVPRYESLLIEREVPKTLHTLTLRGDVPFPLNYTARMNPSWTTQTYDVARGRAYMELKCPEHAEAYKRLKPVAFKADLLRYCILYSEGGVWMDDDILLLKSLDALTANMRRDHLFAFDRRVYKLVGGPGQIWNAFMVAVPGSAVFKRAMVKISENVANEHHFYHSLYYTGPALLYECAERTDSIEFRWRVQHRDAMSSVSRRVADVETDEEVLLHFKLPRASKHYSQMSRANDIYEDVTTTGGAAAAARKILAAFASVGGGTWV